MRIVFINPQGNFSSHGEYKYLGSHPDFGGQLVYVEELAKALAMKGHQVDIITRRIVDSRWVGLGAYIEYYGDIDNLRIIRIPCGGDKFIPKEQLWDHLHEFTIGIEDFYLLTGTKIDFITAHYADGGLVANTLSRKLKVPYSFTAHSLGFVKMETVGAIKGNIKELNKKYNFTKRIIAENKAIKEASAIIASSNYEISNQYLKYYEHACRGSRSITNRLKIISPGINTEIFNNTGAVSSPYSYISQDRRDLPSIILVSRIEAKKNHIGFLKAYAQDEELQKIANVVIQIKGCGNNELTDEMVTIAGSLLGKVCFINLETQNSIACFYRSEVAKKSIFCLPALQEPFGIAPLEAMACGLPVAITKNSGVAEFITPEYGVAIDPYEPHSMSGGVYELLRNWSCYSKYVSEHATSFTWELAAEEYLDIINNVLEK